MPDWVGPGRAVHPPRGAAGDAARRRDRRRRQRADRRRARHAADDRLPPEPRADPALRRGLSRPADPRHGLHRLLRAAGGLADARVLAARRCARSRSSSGAAPRSPRRHAAPCSRSRASSTRRRPRSASAGSAGTLYVILPQALRRLLPPFVEPAREHHPEHDVRGRDRRPGASRGGPAQSERITAVPPIGLGEIHAFEIFAGVAVLFFVISFPLTRLAAYLEKRLV